MPKASLLRFANTLSGKYSNYKQSQENPKDYAHINIYFRPLTWSFLEGPAFYSEQSYDYSPWTPYRQSVHLLKKINEVFIVENYSIIEANRFAGGGFNSEVIDELSIDFLKKRCGCSMHFIELSRGHYKGEIEPGECCFVDREEGVTYLKSEVEFDNENWASLDRGFDKNTNQQVWGSMKGPLKFKRVCHFKVNLKNISQ